MKFKVKWPEDGSAVVLGRLTARDGTGAATGKPGEGNWLKKSDISSITCKVFDLTVSSTVPSSQPTVDVATTVLDTPVTSQLIWTKDTVGYNFEHELPSGTFSAGNHRYAVEYKVTLTGGTVFFGVYEGPAPNIHGS